MNTSLARRRQLAGPKNSLSAAFISPRRPQDKKMMTAASLRPGRDARLRQLQNELSQLLAHLNRGCQADPTDPLATNLNPEVPTLDDDVFSEGMVDTSAPSGGLMEDGTAQHNQPKESFKTAAKNANVVKCLYSN